MASPMKLEEIQSDENLKKYFDLKCDVCREEMYNLEDARTHYLEDHGNDDGYIKCCGREFRKLRDVNDHLLFHFNPDAFK